jgi:hypothetical protein
MKLTLALLAASSASAAPVPRPQLDALINGFGSLFGGGTGGSAANPLAGLTSLIPPGVDLGALASSFLSPPAPGPAPAGGNATAAPANPLAGLLSPSTLGALMSLLGGGAGAGAPAGAPAADPLAALGALLPPGLLPPGLDLGTLASLFGGGAAGAPGGFDVAALLGGADLTSLLGSFLGGSAGPTGDVAVIVTSYNAVKDKVTAMDAVVAKLTPTSDWAAVVPQLNALTKDIAGALEASVKNINGMAGAVDVMSATGLAQPGADVTEATKTSIQNLIAKKDVFPPEARKAEVENLKTLLALTQKFNEAVNSKVPVMLQSIASSQAQQSVDVLQQAITAFSS